MKLQLTILSSLSLPAIMTAAPVNSPFAGCTASPNYCLTASNIFNTCTNSSKSSVALQTCLCADVVAQQATLAGYWENLVECLACLEGFLPGTTNQFPNDTHPHVTIETALWDYCVSSDPETDALIDLGESLTSSTGAPVKLWSIEG